MSAYNLQTLSSRKIGGKTFLLLISGEKDFNRISGNLLWQNLKSSRELSCISFMAVFHFSNVSVRLFGKFEKNNAFSCLMNFYAAFYV